PLMDEGVYLLHALTGLLGPASAVEAMGVTAIPTRTALAGRRAGASIDVHGNDHLLVHLQLRDGPVAQVLSSYAVHASRAPALEVHGTQGSLSLDDPFSAHGRVDMFSGDGETTPGRWVAAEPPEIETQVESNVVAAGAAHFVHCLAGREAPLLSADHARHALEVILKAALSAARGTQVDLTTTFDPRPAAVGSLR
ncbi:MAG: Gfo/Idh/MocA family protein, partial [Thermoleophilaceae bacterium]